MRGAVCFGLGLLLVLCGCKAKDDVVPPVDTEIHPPELPDCEVLWRVDAGFAWNNFEASSPLQPLVQERQIISWALRGRALTDVQAVHRATGAVLWRFSHQHLYRMGGGRFAHSNGQLYVPEWTEANRATLRAISDSSGEVSWATRLDLHEPQELTADAVAVYGYEQHGDSVWLVAIDSASGSRLADVDLSGYEVIFGPITTDAGVVVFTRRAVLLFGPSTLIPLGEFPQEHDLSDRYMPLPMADRFRAVFVENGDLVALDLGNGEIQEFTRWNHEERFGVVYEDAYWGAWTDGAEGQGFHSISLNDGTEARYTYDWLPVDMGAELAVAPDRVARWGSESGVYIFDIDSGAPLCHWEDEGQFLNHLVPIIADGMLYVPGEEELFALRLP